MTLVTRSSERRTRPGKLAEPKVKKGPAGEPEPAPFSITLRDIEIPPAPTETSKPAAEELIVSDPDARPAPWLGDPGAERAAQRAARRAQVRKDRLRDATPEVSPAPAASAAQTIAPSPPTPPAPAAPAVTSMVAPPVANAVETAPATTQAVATPAAGLASSPESAKPAAGIARPAVDAPHAGPAAPSILVLRAPGNDPDPLCDQLSAFGFDVQLRQDPPDLPAPCPFVAVFIDHALRPADGGDAMDLCNEVRERSRLPGVLKPVLVLVADQLSATNRVRAGLAGCNEILLGAITRGGVARVLDTRGIALPSDSRRT